MNIHNHQETSDIMLQQTGQASLRAFYTFRKLMGFGAFILIIVSLFFLNISHRFVTSGFYAMSLMMLRFSLSYLQAITFSAFLNLEKHLYHLMIFPRYCQNFESCATMIYINYTNLPTI